MNEAWVINASPLILLARIGRLDLFERLAAHIIVPNGVRDEVPRWRRRRRVRRDGAGLDRATVHARRLSFF